MFNSQVVNIESVVESPKNWYAVYTKPLWEKKVFKNLERKNIEAYCPVVKSQRQWSDRKKIIESPLFTSYVFVRISEADKLSVKQTDGVVNFVYWLKQPAVIQSEEIEVIKRFQNEHSTLRIEKTAVNLNDSVRILNGPLMEREGNIIEIKHKTIKVLLPSLGYTLLVEIEKTNVEILSIFSRKEIASAQ